MSIPNPNFSKFAFFGKQICRLGIVDFNLLSNCWVSQLGKSEFAVLVLSFEKLRLELDNCGRTTKNAYCRIYSLCIRPIKVQYSISLDMSIDYRYDDAKNFAELGLNMGSKRNWRIQKCWSLPLKTACSNSASTVCAVQKRSVLKYDLFFFDCRKIWVCSPAWWPKSGCRRPSNTRCRGRRACPSRRRSFATAASSAGRWTCAASGCSAPGLTRILLPSGPARASPTLPTSTRRCPASGGPAVSGSTWGSTGFWLLGMSGNFKVSPPQLQIIVQVTRLPSAGLTLHSTKLCPKLGKNIFWYWGYLWGIFKHSPKSEGHMSSWRHTNETLNLLMKLWSFKVILTFFLGSFIVLLCSVDGLTKNVVKQCVAFKPSLQIRPMWALQTHFLVRYRFLKWGSKLLFFFTKLWKSSTIFHYYVFFFLGRPDDVLTWLLRFRSKHASFKCNLSIKPFYRTPQFLCCHQSSSWKYIYFI